VLGVAIGTASASRGAQREDDRDAADGRAFNGVGGGAVALISLVEFRSVPNIGYELDPDPRRDHRLLPSGAQHRLPKLQEIMKGGPHAEGAQRRPAGACLRRVIAAGSDNEPLFWLILVFAGRSACSRWCRSGAPTCRRDLHAERVHRSSPRRPVWRSTTPR
jgi:NAD(P) transhydrogenase subunit beta